MAPNLNREVIEEHQRSIARTIERNKEAIRISRERQARYFETLKNSKIVLAEVRKIFKDAGYL